MTLTIPTSDLTGIIGDCLPFMSGDKEDLERRCVQLRWDGDMLHASALDGIRVAVSPWSPDDPPERDVQDELGIQYGSDDAPWTFLLSADHAKHLLESAKPAKGLEYLPLFLEYDGDLLTVRRAKQSRVPAFSLTYDDPGYDFPDCREYIVAAAAHAEPVKDISFNSALIADFAKPRQRGGCAKWTFGGSLHPTIVEIGGRFVGAIQPVRISEEGA